MPQTLRTAHELRQHLTPLRRQGKTIAFVPTMGALHEGHASLVELAQKTADIVVVSIFVNPTQFGKGEDFFVYPRTEEADLALLATKQVAYVYAPSVAQMYPDYPNTSRTHISVSGITEGLCGASRPGHFNGVALVVTKLLLQVQPDFAIFGEKDYQQLAVIRQLVTDLDIPVEIIAAPTHRESDGLAMSSRNRYLNPAERVIAPAIYRELSNAAAHIRNGENIFIACKQVTQALLAAGFDSVDYCEVRDAKTLSPITDYHSPKTPARIFTAARLKGCRLIDNLLL